MSFSIRIDAMTEIFVPFLYSLAGICAFVAIQHTLIAAHESWDRTHLLFAVLAFSMLLFVVADAVGFHAENELAFVNLRRWQITFAMMLFCALHWFVAYYCDFRSLPILLTVTVFFASGVVVNLLLPYGLGLIEVPELKYVTLPWGEQVLDMRSYRRSPWNSAYWLGIFLSFLHLAYACLHLFRYSKRRAVILGIALGSFLLCLVVNFLIAVGIIEFVGIAEFAFMGLVGVMSYELYAQRRAERQRTAAILDHIPAAVYVKNFAGEYVLSNMENDRLLQANNDFVIGRTDHDFFPQAQADSFREADKLPVATRAPLKTEFTIDRNDELRTFSVLRFPLLDTAGKPYAVAGIATDETEVRRAQAESESLRSQVHREDRIARVGMLVSSLTHELAQPLTAALANAQAGERLIAEEEPDIVELREILADIVRDEKRAAGLISGLRAMLRKKESPREEFDLGTCITDTVALLQFELRTHGVNVRFDNRGRHTVLANRAQIQQVIINLVMNAAHAMSDLPDTDREIRISLTREDKRCRVSVEDTGTGIPDDELNNVFENFYTTTDGLGMGLAICDSIVTSHGGSIWAEAREKPGAQIVFTLPI